MTVAAVGPSGDRTRLSELWGADAVLVRPDQHVAWRGNSAAAAAAALSVAAGRLPRLPQEAAASGTADLPVTEIPAADFPAPEFPARSTRVDAVIP